MIRSLGKFLPSAPASPSLAASKAGLGECNSSDSSATVLAQNLLKPASVCWTALDGCNSLERQSLFNVNEGEDDWEFAGDEEQVDEDVEASAPYLIPRTGTTVVPNVLRLSLPLPAEARLPPSTTSEGAKSNSGLEIRPDIAGGLDEAGGQSSACDWSEPPLLSGALEMEERERRIGYEGVMLEAFQQFQQNPQIQKIVVALATDEGVWRAVLANKKIQEYRFANAKGDFEVGVTRDCKSVVAPSGMTSSFPLLSRRALRELKEAFWDQIRGIIDVVAKKLQAETRRLVLDVMLRALITMTAFVFTLIAIFCLLPLQASWD